MIFHENRLPADDAHEISYIICYFLKSGKIFNCRLLQIIGGALCVKEIMQLTEMNLCMLGNFAFSLSDLTFCPA